MITIDANGKDFKELNELIRRIEAAEHGKL